MGAKSKRKGSTYEYACRDALRDLGGCERMPLSGALGGEWHGDLRWTFRNRIWTIQCKIKADGFRFDYAELADHDILLKRADHKPTLVVTTLPRFIELVDWHE